MQGKRDSRNQPNGFDKLARAYRWLEYATFGPLLWRTRTTFLETAAKAKSGLVLGDGDGRFTAALLAASQTLTLHAVDASSAMLHRMCVRVARQNDAPRLQTLQADAVRTLPEGQFDLVCTHFFLDCLTDAQCEALAHQVATQVPAGGRWIVSEFACPAGRLRWPAAILIRLLYLAFGVLTGLRTRRLPGHAAALRSAGFCCLCVKTRMGGILRAELWQKEATFPHPTDHARTRKSELAA